MSRIVASERSRSPRYPSHSLDQAIDFANKIYDGVHRSSTDSVTAVQLMGFAGKSGASATALGSVRQFGLIEGIGENTRISDLALKILEPADQTERANAINASALLPTVFSQILGRFGERLPPANEPIRAYLIRDLGFSKSGADDCLEALRATIQFAQSQSINSTEPSHDYQVQNSPSTKDSGNDRGLIGKISQTFAMENVASFPEEESELIMIPLTRDCRASLRFHGKITEKAVANLMRHIDLMKDVWAED
jgi:hypothetical protein